MRESIAMDSFFAAKSLKNRAKVEVAQLHTEVAQSTMGVAQFDAEPAQTKFEIKKLAISQPRLGQSIIFANKINYFASASSWLNCHSTPNLSFNDP